jgi:putative ABC transport system ATP-binding protein
MTMILLENIDKVYSTRRGEVRALDGIRLKVKEGEFVVVRGPSGSGKTTLLLTIGGMLRPTRGRALVLGEDLYAQASGARARFRARHVGFVFQMYYLVPYLNTLENVLLAGAQGIDRAGEAEARSLLERLKLDHRAHHRPCELSSGERQRTALARAILKRPRLILADEPTGNLDPENAREVIGHLSDYRENGGTVVLITHGAAADSHAGRILHLREGRLVDPSRDETDGGASEKA